MKTNLKITAPFPLVGMLAIAPLSPATAMWRSLSYQQMTLPDSCSVIIKDELAALRAILVELHISDAGRRRIDRALNDAGAELEIPETEQDRDLIGGAMERAIQYAEKVEGFA